MNVFRKGIRRKTITYLILVGMIPLIIGWMLVYFYGDRSMRNMIGSSFQDLAVETAHRVDQVLEAEVQRIHLLANIPVVRQVAVDANDRYTEMPRDTVPKEIDPDMSTWANGDFPYQEVLGNDAARFLIETKEMAGDTIMGILITDRYGAVVAATSQTKGSCMLRNLGGKGRKTLREVTYISVILWRRGKEVSHRREIRLM